MQKVIWIEDATLAPQIKTNLPAWFAQTKAFDTDFDRRGLAAHIHCTVITVKSNKLAKETIVDTFDILIAL